MGHLFEFAQKPTILLVDDTPDNIALLSALLKVSARLIGVDAVYDALISRRMYKPPFSHEESVSIMREGRGSHFDPDIFDTFLHIEDTFRAIAQRCRDEDVADRVAQSAASFQYPKETSCPIQPMSAFSSSTTTMSAARCSGTFS